MKTQDMMLRPGSNNEFDIYFARAALEEMENETADSRRGSLPVAPPRLLIIRSEPPRRTHSCKFPSRARKEGKSLQTKETQDNSEQLLDVQADTHLLHDHNNQNTDELPSEVKISVELESSNLDHSLLIPGPRLDYKCHSAPHSRSSSWKKSKRPNKGRDRNESGSASHSRDSIPLEESISNRLEQLRLLQEDACCVVRNFATSSKGLINRGDSFKRKSFSVASDIGSSEDIVEDRRPSVHSLGASTVDSSTGDTIYRVVIFGDHGVGKTALVQQFLTSEYMGALETSFDDERERTVSVLLDGEETMIDLIDAATDMDYKQFENIDAYVIVYAMTDRVSFNHAVDILEGVKCDKERHPGVILVANKSDLVRKHQVTSEEAREVCLKHDCKYIEVSAILNHKIDELLVGIVSQIRLQPQRKEKRQQTSVIETKSRDTCASGPRGLLQKLFRKNPPVSKSCDNLLVL